MKEKIRVAVVYGGKSGEHEVSLQSGASVIHHLDKNRFDVIPVSIDKNGKWQFNDLQLIEKSKSKALPIFQHAPEMMLVAQGNGKASLASVQKIENNNSLQDIDVVFPVMHGPLYEDGAIQGLLELADVAYVGSGVLGSAIGMDKDVAKRLVEAACVPVVPYLCLKREHFLRSKETSISAIKQSLSLPIFVKPVNMGSSVGVHKVKHWDDLLPALEDAFLYDRKVLVEKGINAREIELAVLEEINGSTFVSVAGEIIPSSQHEFYSYDAKYLDESGAALKLPADLTSSQKNEAKEIASKCFAALECSGMARVDLFLDKDTNKLYFNEVNTIPGFTAISMYPKMMEASGIPYPELLARLIQLALHQHEAKKGLKRDFSAK
jgi:D-alanine-D-alanine ligase